jgi:hypothetical protein
VGAGGGEETHGWRLGRKKESSSFLKKSTKKLLSVLRSIYRAPYS